MAKMQIDKIICVKLLSKMLWKSKTAMFRVVDRLKSEGKIRHVGYEKSGTWDVIE
jgi:predicted aldo/keto reductase-like oxidoreductase